MFKTSPFDAQNPAILLSKKNMPTVVSHSSSCLLCGLGPTEYKHEQLHKKVFGRQQGILLIIPKDDHS